MTATDLREGLVALLQVQAIDTKLDRVHAQMAALDTGAQIANRYNTGKAEFDKMRVQVEKAQSEQKDCELRLQSLETQINHDSDALYSGKITVPRELEDLQKKIAMLGRQRGEAETAYIEAIVQAETLLKTAQEKEAQLVALATEYKAVRSTSKEQNSRFEGELKTLQAERDQAATGVPSTLLSRYDTVRTKKKGVAIAAVTAGGDCGACHTKLSGSLVDSVRAADQIQTCEHCGRLLAPEPAG